MQPIVTEELVLRPFTMDDLSAFVTAVRESEKTVGEWLSWWHPGYDEPEARQFFTEMAAAVEARRGFDIGVFAADGETFVGGVSINHIDHENRVGNVGYWIRESRQNQGYCTRAVRAMTGFGFETLGLVRLEIIVLVDNVPSRRVAEKCGGTLDCIAENRLIHHGRPSAAAVYALLPS